MFILRPVAQLNSSEVQITEVGSRESGAFGNYVGTHVILHTFRCIVFCKLQQFVYQYFLEITYLGIEFVVNLRQQSLVGQLGAASLNNTREQTLTDNNTFQRRRSFQRSVLHITGLITEDGTEQFLFRRRIWFTLRSNLTDKDIPRLDAGTHTNNTVFVKVFSRFLTYIGNVRSQLFHTTLRFTNFQRIFFHVYRSQKVLTNHAFVQYNSILIVIALPRHVSNQQVLTQCKLSVFGWITFCQNLTCSNALALLANRTEVNRHVLVGTAPFRDIIFFQCRLEAYEFLLFRTVVQNTDSRCIHEFNHTVTLGSNLRTGIACQLTFDTSTYNRSFALQQRNSLTHHVWSHQCTVGVIMLQERNQRSCNRSNLLGRYVHQFHLGRRNHRIVGILTGFYFITYKSTVIVQRSITLRNNLGFLFFCGEVNQTFVRKVNLTICHLTVRSFNEAELVDFRKYAEWRNQTDVRTFRSLDRTKTPVVSIVYVTNLEACTFAWQTARTQGRHTALVSNLGQRVGLIHELWQSIRSKEWIDNGRDCLGVNQVNRSKDFIVTDVHTFADSTRHTCQTDGKLIGQLFAHCTHTTVAQVVDIIHIRFRVNQLDEIFDNFDNIFLGKDTHVHIGRQVQLSVDTITAYITQVISLFWEEQVIDNFACTGIIGWVCITQLAVDVEYSFFFRVTRVLLQSIIYNRIVRLVRFFLVYEDILNTRL